VTAESGGVFGLVDPTIPRNVSAASDAGRPRRRAASIVEPSNSFVIALTLFDARRSPLADRRLTTAHWTVCRSSGDRAGTPGTGMWWDVRPWHVRT